MTEVDEAANSHYSGLSSNSKKWFASYNIWITTWEAGDDQDNQLTNEVLSESSLRAF